MHLSVSQFAKCYNLDHLLCGGLSHLKFWTFLANKQGKRYILKDASFFRGRETLQRLATALTMSNREEEQVAKIHPSHNFQLFDVEQRNNNLQLVLKANLDLQ
jgi:hypothetical protein